MTDLISQLAALDPATRAELERLATASVRRTRAVSRPAAELEAPLTPSQQRMWFLDQLGTDLPTYNVVAGWRVEGALDHGVLRRAWRAVLVRHPALRTVFPAVNEEPRQRVVPAGDPELVVDDLSGTPEEERYAATQRIARREVRHRFDLATGPLIRLRVLKMGEHDHRMLLCAHHIVLDGWSLSIVVSDLLGAYAASGEPSWPELPASYLDFAARSRESDQRHEQDLAYWTDTLAGLPQSIDLPADHPRPARPSFRGHRATMRVDRALAAGLHALARRERATLFTVLLAAWQALLARYTGGTDIPVGTPVSVRPATEFDDVVGLFLNTVVLRGDLTGGPSFAEAVRRTTAHAFDAFEHGALPFERVVERLADRSDLTRNPLFQTLLVVQNTPAVPPSGGGLRLSEMDIDGQVAKFDIGVQVTEHDGGLRCDLDCAADLFEPDTADRIAGHFHRLLTEAVADPQRRISELDLLGVPEQAMLRAWNRTGRAVGSQTLPQQFADIAATHPDHPALGCAGDWLSYADLAARVNRLARRLRQAGVGPDTVVGVCLPRGVDLVVALHAVQAAGGAYLPLDPEYPAERLSFMVADAPAAAVLTSTELARSVMDTGVPPILLDAERAAIGALESGPLTGGAPLDALAYVIYTSGSTGTPKGVGVSHRAIVNRIAWMQEHFPIGAGDRVLQKTPASFDVSVWEFFWPLAAGAALVVAAPGGHRDSGYLVDLMASERVTTVHFVPSMLDAFCDEPDLAGRLGDLRRIFASGEALAGELVTRCLTALPGVELHNLYGPTEAAVDVTWQPCRGLDVSAGVPIGRPVANTTLEIVDRYLRRVPIGVPGELCLAGVQLARGYLNRPALTAGAFVPNPYAPAGARMYRTGDLARWRPDGSVEYLGRLDHQVKIRGFRIELGEIEAALAAQPAVRSAVVLARDGELVAYLVADSDADWPALLAQRLPAHMIPAHFLRIDRLPVTRNGKLDRAGLPDPRTRAGESTVDLPPAEGTETAVAEVWRAVLGVDDVHAGQDFFGSGGDSIRSLKVVARLRARGFAVSLAELFRYRTVRELAAQLDRSGTASPAPAPATAGAFDLLSPADRARFVANNGGAQ